MVHTTEQNRTSIPKIIHHTWFGKDPYPSIVRKCIFSWKKYLPDYEIILWTADNFDMDICPWIREAYDAKKYAFVADYARFYLLAEYGGLYLDADVEILKCLDPLLNQRGFVGRLSSPLTYESLGGAVIGSEKGHPIFWELADEYNALTFVSETKTLNTFITESFVMCNVFSRHGLVRSNCLQSIEGITIYPYEYFPWTTAPGIFQPLNSAYTLHHPYGSWLNDKTGFSKLFLKGNRIANHHYIFLSKILRNTIGEKNGMRLIQYYQKLQK
ncbi:glycosyltransferase family 32 protein [Methanorbis furvi]|uniref:Glycosyl transferase n=1 Tax=Methanorbis furvi TaxID=3028299 RepID=A0AAE4MDW0_9EURY|nr:hypothetical protein [Methanocorpusculaceae archaeon Ag1]